LTDVEFENYTQTMERNEQVKRNLKDMAFNNFVGGIAWGLGATVGVSLIIAILGILISKINLIPFIGTFVSQITSFVLQTNPYLLK